jgi:hypothetical protein
MGGGQSSKLGVLSFRTRAGLVAVLAGGIGVLGAASQGTPPGVDPDASSEARGEAAGILWRGEAGITEMVGRIMERAAQAERSHLAGPAESRPDDDEEAEPGHRRLIGRVDDPQAPRVSRWPPAEGLAATFAPLSAAPSVGVSFDAISIAEAGGLKPPDSMGAAGPAQVLVVTNGRIKVFDRTGLPGDLDADLSSFFATVLGGAPRAVDPQARYDRLSGRWFVTGKTSGASTRILIAVSSGAAITNASSFTFFFFQHDLVSPAGDTGDLADYDSLGIDRFALYIGIDVYDASTGFPTSATGFVVNKAALLGGTLLVSAFRGLNGGLGAAGMASPRGVDNDDPAATQGYFIGSDNKSFGRLILRRVTDPGGTPHISNEIKLTVPATQNPVGVPHLGQVSTFTLDALDDRLFAATIRKNKLTGVSSLWTAHNIEVNASGVAAAGGGRVGSRWYEIGTLTGTPTLAQSGTLFDPAASTPRSFWIPTVVMTGQGHMGLGASTAGVPFRADVAISGRLAGDPLGTTRPFTQATASATSYNVQAQTPQRWGDYSRVDVDPNDDMTIWAFQEYCGAANSWNVRVAQVLAPPPAVPATAAPGVVCRELASIGVTVTGTPVSDSGFFDPGPDTGGPGFPNHLGASVTGGVTVVGAAFVSPMQVSLTLRTLGASAGAQDVTVINPDGQSTTGAGLLTIAGPDAPAASSNGPICAGDTLRLSAATIAGATYAWTGPNGFASSQQNPSIPNATAASSGAYTVRATFGGCASPPAVTAAVVLAEGVACNDGSACTQTDACQAGACAGSNPVVCAPLDQCHDAGVCAPATGACSNPPRPDGAACNDGSACTIQDACQGGLCVGQGGLPVDLDNDTHGDVSCGGDDCDDANPLVWQSPGEAMNLMVATASPAAISWDDQGPLVGPATTYDLVSGTLTVLGGLEFPAGACLQSAGTAGYSDARPDPDVNTAYWYLARARNSCGTGTYGDPVRDAAIPPCP